MKLTLVGPIALSLALGLAIVSAPLAQAQVAIKPEIAGCAELKEQTLRAETRLCMAHTGCALTLNIQKSCAVAGQFLMKLSTMQQDKRKITNNDVFEASMPPLTNQPRLLAEIEKAKQSYASAVGTPTFKSKKSQTASGKALYYEGQLNGSTWAGGGVLINADGDMYRGQFSGNGQEGQIQSYYSDTGELYAGQYSTSAGGRSGEGARQNSDGSVDVGSFQKHRMEGPAERTYPDGSTEKDVWSAGGRILFGPRAAKGEVAIDPQEIERAKQQRAAEDAAIEAAAARVAQMRAAAAAAAEQDRQDRIFQASLRTLGAGELFAKADELDQAGESEKARQARRALIARFPNSPLAVTAAQQLGGAAGSVAAPPRPTAGASYGGAQTSADVNGLWRGDTTSNEVTLEMRSDGLYVRAVTSNPGQSAPLVFKPAGAGEYRYSFPDGQQSVVRMQGPGVLRITNPDGWTDVFRLIRRN